jgi:arylsulfatase A-like enzyme
MKKDSKLNILWICSDQQRFDSLGCYGNPYVKTPNIDALATEGVLFENAYAQNPVCSPSRSSFLTGRYPHNTGCRQNGQPIHSSERPVSKILHDDGYTCGLSGKYHIMPAAPYKFKQSENRIDDGYDVFYWAHGHAPKHPANQYQLWLKEIGVPYKVQETPFCKWIDEGMEASHHETTWCADRAISYIDYCSQFDMPWLFSVNFFDPHCPFDPPMEFLNRYLEMLDDLPLPNYVEGELLKKPAYQSVIHKFCEQDKNKNIKELRPAELTDLEHRYIKAAYYAMIDLIDVQVGRMVDHLKKIGQYENTLIIYMSDHGEMLGDHGTYYKSMCLYEGAVHVPLIFHCPKYLKSHRNSGNIELLHIAPTLLEAAGLEPEVGMQSTSIWKQMCQGEEIADEDVMTEYYNSLVCNFGTSRDNFTTMVRSKNHKISLCHGSGEGELYDLQADPTETVNLFDDPAYRDVKIDMLIRLCNKMAWSTDPLPEKICRF